MKINNFLIIFIFLLILILILLALGIILFRNNNTGTNTIDNNQFNIQDGSKVTNSESKQPNSISKTNLNMEDVVVTKANRITINELYIASEILDYMNRNNIDPRRNPNPKIDIRFLNLNDIAKDEISKREKLLLNKEYNDLLLTTLAQKEIYEEIISSRREFLEYLKFKGLQGKYIEEFDYVLPEDSKIIKYHIDDDPRLPGASVDSVKLNDFESDSSRQQLDVYAGGLSYRMDIFKNSGILGNEPKDASSKNDYLKKLRTLAIRHLLYHEFVHTLQLVYVNQNVSDPKFKGDWFKASRNPTDFDSSFYWDWGLGESLNRLNNEIVSKESQAEGVSFEVTVSMLNLSRKQSEILWEHYFGRYENAKKYLDNIATYFNSKFKGYSIEDFQTLLSDTLSQYQGSSENKSALLSSVFRLTSIHAYVGYLNPILPQNIDSKFWSNFSK